MATPDFTPLFRTTIGFDRVPNLLAEAMQRTATRLTTSRNVVRTNTALFWQSLDSAKTRSRSSPSRTYLRCVAASKRSMAMSICIRA